MVAAARWRAFSDLSMLTAVPVMKCAMSRFQTLSVVVFSVLLALASWYVYLSPRAVAAEWQGPLKSASFAPFRDGQSPLKEVFPTAQQIEDDLLRLKGIFSGIRTYTALDGMEVVPSLADKHGFRLTHSAWLGREAARNNREVEALIHTANQYPQAVTRVIVGNEVLLRQDLKPEELIAYIDRVRGAIKQPVSYADVWAFWLKYPQVAEHVDYLTIHILPYWEDEPVSVEDAEQHLLDIVERIKQRFPGKPILIGETGWPTEGRSRGPAAANLLTAAEYVRRVPALAAEHGFDYNIVEAYDQPWKAQLEGTVGARWGLFDADRQLKFALTGPVLPIDYAWPRALASVTAGLLIAVLLLSVANITVRSGLLLAVWSQLFGAALVQSVYMALRLAVAPSSFTWAQQHLLFSAADHGLLSQASVAWWYKLLLQQLVEPLAHGWAWLLAGFALVFALSLLLWLRGLLQGRASELAATVACRGFGLYALAAVIFAAIFATSGRYMDMPVPHYGLPLLAALALVLLQRDLPAMPSHAFAVFSRCGFFNRHALLILAVTALACVWGEVGAMLGGADFIAAHPDLAQQIPVIALSLLANHELLLWCAMCVALALPFRLLKPR